MATSTFTQKKKKKKKLTWIRYKAAGKANLAVSLQFNISSRFNKVVNLLKERLRDSGARYNTTRQTIDLITSLITTAVDAKYNLSSSTLALV
jgi:hypothetical protein